MIAPDNEARSEDTLTSQEAFFQAAANGEVATLKALLSRREQLNIDVNGKNEEGYSAMQLAVLEGYVVIVKELLMVDVYLGDALLRAADVEFELAVKSLLDYVSRKPEDERDRLINCHCEGSDFHPSLTPIMRAAQKNNYGIVKLLLDAGARIPESKMEVTSETSNIDSLLQSVGLVERYSAIATPAYVTQAYMDPIDKAFKLTKTLTQIGDAEVEHKLVFQEMAKKMEQLAADLIGEARNTNEILTVLRYSERPDNQVKTHSIHVILPKIARAIAFRQKRFVAEPNCQQAVSTQFRRQLLGVGDWSIAMQTILLIGVALSHPILSIGYKLGFGGEIEDFVETPYIKFLMQLGSDIALLGILVAKTFLLNQTWEVKVLIVFVLLTYAAGIFLKETMFLYYQGPKKFFTGTGHYRDVTIASLLLTQCVLEALHISELRGNLFSEPKMPFVNRPWNDFEVLSPAILSLLTVIAFMRIMPYVIANDVIGAFQISLGDMIVNTSHFFVILLAVFVSFATGMTYLYGDTAEGSRDIACRYRRGDCSDVEVHFDNIAQTTLTLYWSLYGLIGTDVLQLPVEQRPIHLAGVCLFAFFHIFAVLILLNALIAVMSNVYNSVEENADVEWKYSRTALWMSFMDDSFVVPPPFNLIPHFGKMCSRVKKCYEAITKRRNVEATMEMHDYRHVPQEDYQRVINQLMERYVTNRLTTEQSANSDIGPMDIRDLRNDLASLRFDITTQLCQMEESITQGRHQSDKIYGQSTEANTIFRRTIEIDAMVDKYKAALLEIYQNVEKYKDILPALADLELQMDAILPGSSSTEGKPSYGIGLVPALVRRYEQKKKAQDN